MDENINFQNPDQEESFSFSCSDFNSSLVVFSDEDDDEDDDDNESFIEIALEPPTSHEDEGETDELDIRISFSTMVNPKVSEISSQSPTHNYSLLSKTCEAETQSSSSLLSSCNLSSSTGSVGWGRGKVEPDQNSSVHKAKAKTWRSQQYRTFNRILNMLGSSLRVSAEIDEGKAPPDENRKTANWEPLRVGRKASKVTAAVNGRIMKILIKFRSVKIRPMLASVMKPRQVISPQGNSERNKRTSEWTFRSYQSLIKPLDKWLVQKDQGKSSIGNNTTKNSCGDGENSRVLEINLDAVKSVLQAVSTSLSLKDKQAKSCPSSIKCSPIHKGVPSEIKTYMTENSVQAAIAHCKRSFGQTPDSCF